MVGRADRIAASSGQRGSRFAAGDYLLAVGAGLLATILYLRTLAPGLLGGDSGELQMAAWLGGFAHPTGYPLYLSLGALWTHLLRAGDPAWRLNLFSALWGGAAVGLTYLLALRLTRLAFRADEGSPTVCRLASFTAACAFAATPTFWSQALIAEVYTLNAVFVAGVLLGVTTWAAQPAERPALAPLYGTAALYGLSLTHHRTMLLLIPAVAVYLWLERRRLTGWRRRLGSLARAVPLIGLPLLLYLYIPLRAPHVPYAEVRIGPEQTLHLYRPTVDWFVRHISGEVFSSALGASAGVLDRLADAAGRFVSEMTWPGLLLGAMGIASLARRSRSLLALTGLGFGAVITFNIFYAIGDIHVFYIPAYFLWTLWMALGLVAAGVWAGRLLAGRRPATQRAALFVPALLGLALPAWSAAHHYRSLDQSSNNEARATWQAILAQPIPGDAILVSNDRDEMVPLWYLQYVEGVRPDLTGLFPLIQPTPEWADIGQVLVTARRSGRPVFLIKPMPGLETKFLLEPVGALMRVAGPAVTRLPQRPVTVDYDGAIRLTGYDLEPAAISDGGTVKITLYWQPQRQLHADYTAFVHLVNADGAVIGASDHRPGGTYYPTSLWRPGDTLKDVHAIALSPDLGPGPFAIEAGLYTGTATLQHLGRPERIGRVARERPSDTIPADRANRGGFTFGDEIELAAYQMTVRGHEVILNLFWRALQAPMNDYTAFVHILDSDGRIVAQADQPPGGRENPTSTWTAGQVFAASMVIRLPDGLPPGRYRLIGGLYDVNTQARLPASGAAGHRLGDTVDLAGLVWQPTGNALGASEPQPAAPR